jgi:hypothetical protein
MPLKKWGMLVLDAFEGHLTPGIRTAITGSFTNKDLVIIPRGITSKLQVLDISGGKKTIKDHLKKLYLLTNLLSYSMELSPS